MLLFFSVVIFIVTLIHYYLWRRFVHNTALKQPWRRFSTGLIIALGVSLPAATLLSRNVPLQHTRWAFLPVYIWMGAMLFCLCVLLVFDLALALLKLSQFAKRNTTALPDPSRRVALARIGAGATLGIVAPLSAVGVYNAKHRIEVKQQTIYLPRLPTPLDGFKIVQLCDLHIGPILGHDWLASVVAQVMTLNADAIVIIGDLVDGSVDRLKHDISPLNQLRAQHGVYFVTGNHEYYAGAVPWVREIERQGIFVLRNERISIGRGGHYFDLAGTDDFKADGLAPGHGQDLKRALAGRDPARELILLAHQPRTIFEAATYGVSLQLSGHTHGGQFWPWNLLVPLQQPYVRGLAQHDRTQTQIYVSQGTGFWGPPIRVGTVGEITHITLKTRV